MRLLKHSPSTRGTIVSVFSIRRIAITFAAAVILSIGLTSTAFACEEELISNFQKQCASAREGADYAGEITFCSGAAEQDSICAAESSGNLHDSFLYSKVLLYLFATQGYFGEPDGVRDTAKMSQWLSVVISGSKELLKPGVAKDNQTHIAEVLRDARQLQKRL